MLKSTIQDALNAQIKMELSAFYTYLSMSAHFESMNWEGFAAWMHHHAEEEMEHAMRIYNYVQRRGGRVVLAALDAPTSEWDSIEDVIADALGHEEKVSASINKLVDLARDEHDHATESFLQWFVDEQVEEEEVVDRLLQKVKQVGDNTSALYLIDRDLLNDEGIFEEDEDGDY